MKRKNIKLNLFFKFFAYSWNTLYERNIYGFFFRKLKYLLKAFPNTNVLQSSSSKLFVIEVHSRFFFTSLICHVKKMFLKMPEKRKLCFLVFLSA